MKTSLRYFRNSVLFIILLTCTLQVHSQSCPRGVRYDCVWGCGRHIDQNGDGFCDYSFLTQPETKNTDSVPARDSVKVIPKDTMGTGTAAKQHRNGKGAGNRRSEEQTQGSIDFNQKQSLNNDEELEAGTENQPLPSEETQIVPPANAAGSEPLYDLIFVSSITLGLYFLTLILYKRNIIKRIHHRKLWNLLLLLTFIVSCLFGFFLVIQLNYNVAMKAFKTLLYWHVEIGISMTIIAVIHILWHLTYFKNMLKKW